MLSGGERKQQLVNIYSVANSYTSDGVTERLMFPGVFVVEMPFRRMPSRGCTVSPVFSAANEECEH